MSAVPPAIVVVGFVLALALPQPSFQRSQPKFDAFVASLPATGPVSMNNQSIDSFDFTVSRYLDDTAVHFVDDDTVFFTYVAGWIYSPDHPPQQKPGDELEYTSLGGPWYEYSLVFDFD